ncbi:MAG: Asp/Glu racemase [Pseudomonadota bacterium]
MTGSTDPLSIRTTPALGLIVLRVDETIEDEFRGFIPRHQARVHISRIHSGDDLTPESIARMETRLTEAASLLPPAANFDVVAYACTSGTAVLGAETVERLVLAGVRTRAVTNPLTAAVEQIRHLGLGRIGIVSPYVSTVAEALSAAFEANGVQVASSLTLEESDEATVARIEPAVTADAARRLAAKSDIDGVFLSCTNLKTAAILDGLASELSVPVLSSNRALAWHMTALTKSR